jgi:hypothetical protein
VKFSLALGYITLIGAGCSFDTQVTGSLASDAQSVVVDASTFDANTTDSAVADAAPIDAPVDAAPVDASPDGQPDAAFVSPTPVDDTLFALRHPGVTLDGDLSDWVDDSFVTITAPTDFVSTGGNAADGNDLSARIGARWTDTNLYVAFEVTDDQHTNTSTGVLIWQGDSMQIGVDVSQNGGTAYDGVDDFEYGWAIANGGTLEAFRWISPGGGEVSITPAPSQVVRNGTTTTYEVTLTPADLGLGSFDEAGGQIGFSLMVNENDGAGRDGFIEWTSGIGAGKNPGLFGTLVFHPEGPQI